MTIDKEWVEALFNIRIAVECAVGRLMINMYVLVTSSFNMVHFHPFLTCFPLLLHHYSRFFVKLLQGTFRFSRLKILPRGFISRAQVSSLEVVDRRASALESSSVSSR